MAHNNTLLHSMLKFIPRHDFSILEKRFGTGRKARTFNRWNQFVHLMFMQLTSRSSLRDGIQAITSRARNLYHLGSKPVSRSTFADANAKRPSSFYEELFQKAYNRCQPIAPKHKFKFKNKLYSMDASVIDLALSIFPWAAFRKTKAAIKIHTLLDNAGYLPPFYQFQMAKPMKSK
jgi:putative transposase